MVVDSPGNISGTNSRIWMKFGLRSFFFKCPEEKNNVVSFLQPHISPSDALRYGQKSRNRPCLMVSDLYCYAREFRIFCNSFCSMINSRNKMRWSLVPSPWSLTHTTFTNNNDLFGPILWNTCDMWWPVDLSTFSTLPHSHLTSRKFSPYMNVFDPRANLLPSIKFNASCKTQFSKPQTHTILNFIFVWKFPRHERRNPKKNQKTKK